VLPLPLPDPCNMCGLPLFKLFTGKQVRLNRSLSAASTAVASPPATAASNSTTSEGDRLVSETADLTIAKLRATEFLKLPAEIRRNIYGKLFERSLLEIGFGRESEDGSPCPYCQRRLRYFSGIYERGQLPDLLLTSKTIRDEALPFFSRSLTLALGDEASIGLLSSVPAHYRVEAKIPLAPISIDIEPEWSDLMPGIQEVRLYQTIFRGVQQASHDIEGYTILGMVYRRVKVQLDSLERVQHGLRILMIADQIYGSGRNFGVIVSFKAYFLNP
jgi:hypothetical protein